MTKYVEKSRKALPVTLLLNNILCDRHRRRSNDPFRRMDNLLYNCFGPPKYELKYDLRKFRRHYFAHNKDAVWYRCKNEFMFKDQKTLDIVMKFKSDEFVVTNKII